MCATIIAAITLWWLSRGQDQAPEAISMLLLTGGLATALLLTHLQKDNPVSLDTYLFGSILTITEHEMWSFIALSMAIVGALLVFWKPFLTLVFDKDFFKTQPRAIFYEVLFMILIALVVGIGLKVIGGLLIGALLVTVITGIFVSFYLDVPTSSAIVLSLIAFYVVSKVNVLQAKR